MGDEKDCICNAGYTGNYSYCTQCKPGWFKTGIGFEPCIECLPGTYSDRSSLFCQMCPGQSTSPIASSSEQDCQCGPGYTQNLDVPSSQLVCIACSAGKYKILFGSANCSTNPPNSSSDDAAVIFTCNAGYYVNKNRDGCAVCDIAYRISDEDVCNGSQYFDSQQCSCVSCPVHQVVKTKSRFVWNESLDHEGKIPGELLGAQSIEDCVCQPGFFSLCVSCPRPCDLCPRGTYNEEPGVTACFDCPQETNGTVVLTSEAGSDHISQCTCPPGYIVVDRDLLPEIRCSACEAGSNSSGIGSSVCTLCPIQKTSPVGSSVCNECRQGDVCVCNVGYTLNLGEGLLCIPCSQGTYKNSTGPQPCTPCQQFLRFQNLPGMTSCRLCTPTKRCPIGMYWQTCGSDYDGSCLPCNNPKPLNAEYIGPGSPLNNSVCPWKCKNGYELTTTNGLPVCKACPAGTFKGSQQSNCTKCPRYSTNLVSGQKACTRCLDGYYLSGFSNQGHAICLRCSTSHSTINSSGIRAGSYFSDACKCESGFFGCSWNCTECPSGTYKDHLSMHGDEDSECALDTCIDCPDGTYSIHSGQSSLSSCRNCDNTTLGSFYNRTGCECPPNYFFEVEHGKCTNASRSK